MPIVQTASILNVLQSAVASAERAFELLDAAEEILDVAQPERLEHAAGQVVFDDVSFRYLPAIRRTAVDGQVVCPAFRGV